MGAGATVLASSNQENPSNYASAQIINQTSSYDFDPPSRFGTKPKHDDFTPGDILKVLVGRGKTSEGLMVERINNDFIIVDFGATNLQQCHVEDCELVIKADELEVGDKVEVKPPYMNLYFVGKILRIKEHGSSDSETISSIIPDSIAPCNYKQSIITKISASGSGKRQIDRNSVVITRSTAQNNGAYASSPSKVSRKVTSTATITVDVLMEGDDEEDIEYNIPFENVRKLMSRRALAITRWKKAFMMIVAANNFRNISSAKLMSTKSFESPEADDSD